ncbi:3-phosphoglycerate dehydrogenase [Clostridium sp. MCC353]|uniref:NAD(P)-dependent oxidoreductase n=1 Tax=Clostridium sp. MCC353 TaxID=2592646 RepID=UPI001C026977|nr:3-phosphoglycerate dehydrogenase [Clostridium sp. MCC353]
MLKICIAGTYPEGTGRIFEERLPAGRFKIIEADTQEQFDEVTDADVVILRIFKMPKEAFGRFANLKMVMRWGAGYDSVDVKEAARRGITVCNTPGANAYAVAELAVGLMIDVGRNIFGYYGNVRQDNWDRNAFNKSVSLNGKVVGLLGGGNIGRQVAERVAAFGASVQYYDTYRLKTEIEERYHMKYVDFDTLLRTSNIISIHIPLTDDTYHILGEDQLEAMEQSPILINTARGGLVDDAALLAALQSGRIFGAGLDCVEDEQSQVTKELMQMVNVIVTPHIGGSSSDLGSAIIPMIIENIVKLEAGEPVSYIVKG